MSKASVQEQVLEFHLAFDHPIYKSPDVPPDDRVRFRARLITEEFIETLAALFDRGEVVLEDGSRVSGPLERAKALLVAAGDQLRVDVDLVEFVDGMSDLDYVVEGSRIEFGVEGGAVAREVHRSNMAKMTLCSACEGSGQASPGTFCPMCGGKGRILLKRADGKTLKPAGWTPPDIAGVLAAQMAEPAKYGLKKLLNEQGPKPERGGKVEPGLYRHYKGPLYVVFAIAETHEHNGDRDVIYSSLTNPRPVTRPLERDSRNEPSWLDMIAWTEDMTMSRFMPESREVAAVLGKQFGEP